MSLLVTRLEQVCVAVAAACEDETILVNGVSGDYRWQGGPPPRSRGDGAPVMRLNRPARFRASRGPGLGAPGLTKTTEHGRSAEETAAGISSALGCDTDSDAVRVAAADLELRRDQAHTARRASLRLTERRRQSLWAQRSPWASCPGTHCHSHWSDRAGRRPAASAA